MMKKYFQKKLIASLMLASAYVPATLVHAAEHSNMQTEEHMHDHGDDPLMAKVMFDQLEVRNEDGANPFAVEAQAWIGKDLHKLWLKVDAEKHDGEFEEVEVQALYSHAIAPYWDLQIGLRKDIKPSPSRTWGVLGVQGLAPYFFEVGAALFVGDAGKTALRLSAEYELLFTQKLILSPETEINFYGQNDLETGSGLSNINAGLRLRYELKREFAPYIGINWNKQFGATADIAEHKREPTSDTSLVVGVRMWF